MHGWILCRYCATGWFWWISGLRAVTMWSSSSFTKTDRHQRSRTIQPTTANRRGCEISPLAWLHQALGYIYSLFVLRKHRWVSAKKRRYSIANALELRLSCTNPSTWYHVFVYWQLGKWQLSTNFVLWWCLVSKSKPLALSVSYTCVPLSCENVIQM